MRATDPLALSSGTRPRHAQLAVILQGRILSGRYRAGERIDTEHQLAERFDVSRSTVRQALAELANLGYITTRKGSGTFVADRLPRRLGTAPSAAPLFTGFLEDLILEGGWATDADHRRDEVPASEEIAELLRCPVGSSVVRYRRLRMIGGECYGVAEDFLPQSVAELLADDEDLRSQPSLLHAIAKAGVEPFESMQRVQPTKASAAVAAELGLAVGDPVMLVTGLTVTADGDPLDAYRLYLGPDYSIQLRFVSVGSIAGLVTERQPTSS